MSPHKNTAAIILSGGRGNRLEGVDKGLQLLNGKPLIEHVINSIQPQVKTIVISINRNEDKYNEFNFLTIKDETANSFNGPIAGILSVTKALASENIEHFLISTCDCPLLPNNYLEKLSSHLGTSNVAVVYDGERRQNLHCLIKESALNSLRQFYNDGGRAMHCWLKKINAISVDFSDQANCFNNINTFDQLTDN